MTTVEYTVEDLASLQKGYFEREDLKPTMKNVNWNNFGDVTIAVMSNNSSIFEDKDWFSMLSMDFVYIFSISCAKLMWFLW